MQKTKAIVLLIVASVLLVAIAGIAISQVVSAQNAGNTTNQTPQSASINGYGPLQGTYPNGQQYGSQYGAPNGHRMGMGMCGRFW